MNKCIYLLAVDQSIIVCLNRVISFESSSFMPFILVVPSAVPGLVTSCLAVLFAWVADFRMS